VFLEAVNSFQRNFFEFCRNVTRRWPNGGGFFRLIARGYERVQKGFGEIRNHLPGTLIFQGEPALLHHPTGERIYWFGSGPAPQVPLGSPAHFRVKTSSIWKRAELPMRNATRFFCSIGKNTRFLWIFRSRSKACRILFYSLNIFYFVKRCVSD